MNQKIAEQLYDLTSKIPSGKVTTYGALAKALKINPRQVGYYLHQNPDPSHIPCHRVVNSQGRLTPHFAFGGLNGQSHRLNQEQVIVKDQKVDLNKFGWEPSKIEHKISLH